MAEQHTHGTTYDKSDESTLTEIGVGKAEGAAYAGALKYLTTMEASDSGQQEIGDYLIAYSIENAEGLYHMESGQLVWHEPKEENCHLEIAVCNAADGRFLPGLKVHAKLTESATGKSIGDYELPFLWHPWVYHYGKNLAIPRDEKYKLNVHVDAPDFARHDRVNGRRFHDALDATFEITIKTGRKQSQAA